MEGRTQTVGCLGFRRIATHFATLRTGKHHHLEWQREGENGYSIRRVEDIDESLTLLGYDGC